MEPRDLRLAGATAAEFSERKFGGRTRTVESRPAVPAAGSLVLRGNPRRVFALVVNNSSVQVGAGFDTVVAYNTGIVLGATGGFLALSVDEDGDVVANPIFAAGSSASGNLYCVEIERE